MAPLNLDSDDELLSGINVTPLVDVVLVLLIIFLITAPVIYQSAIKVDLPKAKTGQSADSTPLGFTVTKEGAILVGRSRKLEWQDVTGYVRSLPAQERARPATISADQETGHGVVVRLMDVLRQEGILKFSLSVDGAP